MHTLEGKCNAQWRNANEFNAHTAHWRNAMHTLGGNTMHTGEMNCTVEKCNAMHSVHCTLEKEGMQCNAQWGNAKQCTLHTGGGSAMHPWHLSGQPLHLVDEMLMPWAVQRFSLQRCPVLDGQFTVHCTVYNVHSQCSAVW